MKLCPNCNSAMTNNSFFYRGLGDWDMDYPANYYERYVCPHCDIEYVNGNWSIPDKFLATDKQQRTMLFISSVLGIEPPAPTKAQAGLFISEHFAEAKKVRLRQLYNLALSEDCF